MLMLPPFDGEQLRESDDPALWRAALDHFLDCVELDEETHVTFKPHPCRSRSETR